MRGFSSDDPWSPFGAILVYDERKGTNNPGPSRRTKPDTLPCFCSMLSLPRRNVQAACPKKFPSGSAMLNRIPHGKAFERGTHHRREPKWYYSWKDMNEGNSASTNRRNNSTSDALVYSFAALATEAVKEQFAVKMRPNFGFEGTAQ